MVRKLLQVDGMSCASCEIRIENRLKKIAGVSDVKASFGSATVRVSFEPPLASLEQITAAIDQLGYQVRHTDGKQSTKARPANGKLPVNQLLGIGIIAVALYLIIKNTVGFNFIPQINQNMGYGLLFAVGLITSLHCVAMCGGINLAQCVKHKASEPDASGVSRFKPSLKYNVGRVLSYTIIGGTVGALGSVVSFSGPAKGIVAVLSGIFMVIMGVNMLGIFPWLRKFNPRIPKFFGNKIHSNSGQNGPFFVGMLNGLMPCGPLQAMQIYALGTGNALAGATSMFFFSLGTVPLMFGFGAISSYLSGKFTHRLMKVSAVLVMVLGVIMLNRGLNLSGLPNIAYAASVPSGNVAKLAGNVQVITTSLSSGRYEAFIVQAGVPVKWTITASASQLNGCNETVTIPKYGISQRLVPGDNVIEFTPDKEGNVPYTCWMGMISSNIRVVADITKVSSKDIVQAGSASTANGAGGCCGAIPPQFAGGKIPTDRIEVAKIANGQQTVIITVNNEGYTPAVVVLQKGVPAKITFNPEQLSGCNSTIVFPELKGQMNLNTQTVSPIITPDQDFTFQCSMAMLHGYVKVVDDINKVNLGDIAKEVQAYRPAAGRGGAGGGCCGG